MPQACESAKRSREDAATDISDAAGAEAISPLQPTASVKVADMDADHAACDAALDTLRVQRDAASVAAVIDAYETHFAREEALLDQHLYAAVAAAEQAGSAPAFSADASARKSHREAHRRMLTDLRKAKHACTIADDARVPVAAVDKVLRDFEQHAATYDLAYADRLSSALAAA